MFWLDLQYILKCRHSSLPVVTSPEQNVGKMSISINKIVLSVFVSKKRKSFVKLMGLNCSFKIMMLPCVTTGNNSKYLPLLQQSPDIENIKTAVVLKGNSEPWREWKWECLTLQIKTSLHFDILSSCSNTILILSKTVEQDSTTGPYIIGPGWRRALQEMIKVAMQKRMKRYHCLLTL